MVKNIKKLVTAMLVGVLTVGLLAGCGGGGASSSDSGDASGGDKTAITIFNSKMEIQSQRALYTLHG